MDEPNTLGTAKMQANNNARAADDARDVKEGGDTLSDFSDFTNLPSSMSGCQERGIPLPVIMDKYKQTQPEWQRYRDRNRGRGGGSHAVEHPDLKTPSQARPNEDDLLGMHNPEPIRVRRDFNTGNSQPRVSNNSDPFAIETRDTNNGDLFGIRRAGREQGHDLAGLSLDDRRKPPGDYYRTPRPSSRSRSRCRSRSRSHSRYSHAEREGELCQASRGYWDYNGNDGPRQQRQAENGTVQRSSSPNRGRHRNQDQEYRESHREGHYYGGKHRPRRQSLTTPTRDGSGTRQLRVPDSGRGETRRQEEEDAGDETAAWRERENIVHQRLQALQTTLHAVVAAETAARMAMWDNATRPYHRPRSPDR